MIDIKNIKDCCGCNACVQRCPKECIAMHEDNEGFLYPTVDKKACIDCGLCEKVCPIINQEEPRIPLKVYAAKNKNEQIRQESSSGGVFTLLAEQTIAEGGVVFGARFNNKWEVIHDYTEIIEGLAAFRGSKYVQSRIGKTYKQAEKFLIQGRKILFSGTPCQIAGLNRFLRNRYDNLLTVDIICHGVPSPKVFRLYLDEISNNKVSEYKDLYNCSKISGAISHINFRDKSTGWKNYSFVARVSNTHKERCQNSVLLSETADKNIFMRGFLRDLYLRPSCHACPSKSLKSGSDITIADYWGIANYYPEFDDDKGVSMVLINTINGKVKYDALVLDGFETPLESAIRFNSSFTKSVIMPEMRNNFFMDLTDNIQVINLTNKHLKVHLFERLKAKVNRLIKQ